MSGKDQGVGLIATWVAEARAVVVLTGAGISTESGIPDFRGPQGVWTKDPQAEKLSHIGYYMSDPEIRKLAWRTRLDHPALHAQPNPAHIALAELERKGKLTTLITQNIDGLHQKAGSSEDRLIEIHGNIREVVCMSCAERAPMERALDRVRAGEEDPNCRSCGGILKSATISFGQSLVADDLERARRAAESCDLFLAVGTSLGVYPAAHLPQIALEAGARLAILNAGPTPFDSVADAAVDDSVTRSLVNLMQLVDRHMTAQN
ncbi:MAG: Sir2 family NAD-dependent protein deacetylase [Actinomycetota bacterium]|nr:Sir2 family NAD-dependent protein deacetylase [Actinomycetota bacterium]